MDEHSVRAALYARVSTEEQAMEGFSLDAQLGRLRKYCSSQGWIVADEYREEGHSGRNIKRPEYTRMMDESEKWDIVLVLKMDRIHRNSENFTRMMKDLNASNKGFCSVMEQFDTSNAMGRFVMDLIQRIAQLESEQIGERTKFGMIQKAEQKDGIMGFQPPYGYSIADGELISIPEEQIIVKRIFGSYLENSTLDEIASELNSSFIRTRNGNQWNKYNLRNILHNPVYAGYMHWEEHLIGHHVDCPVSVDEYNQVQRLMASKTRGAKKNLPILLDVEESL